MTNKELMQLRIGMQDLLRHRKDLNSERLCQEIIHNELESGLETFVNFIYELANMEISGNLPINEVFVYANFKEVKEEKKRRQSIIDERINNVKIGDSNERELNLIERGELMRLRCKEIEHDGVTNYMVQKCKEYDIGLSDVERTNRMIKYLLKPDIEDICSYEVLNYPFIESRIKRGYFKKSDLTKKLSADNLGDCYQFVLQKDDKGNVIKSTIELRIPMNSYTENEERQR